MISTVVSVKVTVGENLIIKKNRLSPDFPTGDEKRICIVSGIYGDELQGQYVCYEVVKRIKKQYDMLTGIVDVYPSINPFALEAKTREIPGTEMDMNTLFPGSPDGSLGEYIAYSLMADMEDADFCLDVHSSNLYLHEILQIRMNDEGVEELLPYAKLLNTDMIWVHPSSSVRQGSLAYELNKRGTKCFVTESNFAYNINQNYCNQLVDGIFALMKELGIWQGRIKEPRKTPIVYDDQMSFINSESSGIFVPKRKVYGKVKEREVIGYIIDAMTGSVTEEILSPRDGMITAMRAYPAIEEGSLLARVVETDDE